MRVDLCNVANWAVTIILLAYFSSAISKELDTIYFSFAPGENISFTQKLTTIKEKDMGDKGKQLDESVSTTKITIIKTKSGWDVLAEPRSISMKRNGEEINNPIVSFLSSAVITYKLDSDGNILDVDGYEPFIEGISKQVTPEVFKQLKPILNIEAMKSKEIAEWNGRIGDYVGAEAQIGDSFVADVPYQIPNGATINYSVQTKIAALVPCGDNKCVRIEQVYDSQADNLAKMTGEVVSNVTEAAVPEIIKPSSESNTAIIKGNVTRVIDPKTMLVYEEESKRTIAMEIDIPGAGLVPVKTSETRKYEFEY
jgi:hypothetical protein